MDGIVPPTALYAVLSVTVAVIARVTAESADGRFLIKPWVIWLLHLPVAVAWLHLLGYLVFQIVRADRPLEMVDLTNLIIHTATLASAGLAGAWIFIRQSSRLASSSTPP